MNLLLGIIIGIIITVIVYNLDKLFTPKSLDEQIKDAKKRMEILKSKIEVYENYINLHPAYGIWAYGDDLEKAVKLFQIEKQIYIDLKQAKESE